MKKLVILVIITAVGYGAYSKWVPDTSDWVLDEGNQVAMYSLTSCGLCRVMKAELENAGIPFEEIFLDKMDQPEQQSLFSELAAAGYTEGGGVPFFKVNGTWVSNERVSLSDVEEELFYKE